MTFINISFFAIHMFISNSKTLWLVYKIESERRRRKKENQLPWGDKRVKWSSCSPAAINNAKFAFALFCQYHRGPPSSSDTPPPLSLRHSAHMSNYMTSECSAWTAISPKSCSWIIEVDVYLWGPLLPFSWQATLKMQDCEDGKEGGRWGAEGCLC